MFGDEVTSLPLDTPAESMGDGKPRKRWSIGRELAFRSGGMDVPVMQYLDVPLEVTLGILAHRTSKDERIGVYNHRNETHSI